MKVYAGIDLHSTNNYIGIIDERGRKVFGGRSANKLDEVTAVFSGYTSDIAGIVVESTYNWYWLVDDLKENGYIVHLANPAAIQKYKGLKHAGDRHDAFWLAEMLRLNILPSGYIYPKDERSIRDLLRTRSMLVGKRTGLIISLSGIIARNTGKKLKCSDIKMVTKNHVYPLLSYDDNLLSSGDALKEIIDCLTRKIREIETKVLKQVSLRPGYECLQMIPGVGTVLGLTIMLETGPITRFKAVGNYVSYCRKVSSKYVSNDKTKGRGNAKNGNRYLAWAFGEAAEYARRYDDLARSYYNRKCQKTNAAVAHSALAHKLARAAYHMMKNNEPFIPKRVFT